MNTPTILIVDDDTNMINYLEQVLRKYKTIPCSNGVEALSLIENRKINIIVTDLKMPVIDGLELVKKMRKTDPDIGIVMLTAYRGIDSYLEALDLGIFEYLFKPVKKKILLNVIKKILKNNRIPDIFIKAVLLFSILPFVLHVGGMDFGFPVRSPDFQFVSDIASNQLPDSMFFGLSGAFIHTILEWSAFCTAILTVILAFVHFNIKRDVVTPIIGVALICAGSMDAFHILAADRLIDVVADNRDFIPFTWAICRLFNALIMITGCSLVIFRKEDKTYGSTGFVIIISLAFGVIAYAIIHICATGSYLPQTMYPGEMITRPFDVAPLILFAFAGIFVYPRLYKKEPGIFSHALILSVVPELSTQFHMAFGSTRLFDSHFNMAHFIKIIAYIVPFIGICLDYNKTYRESDKEIKGRKKAEKMLRNINENLELTVNQRTGDLLNAKKQLERELKDRKLLQSQLIQAQKLESIGQLAAGIAHEINTPTQYVGDNTTFLQDSFFQINGLLKMYENLALAAREGEVSSELIREIEKTAHKMDMEYLREEIPEAIKQSLEGIDRISGIVLSMKEFSHPGTDEKEPVDINRAIKSTITVSRNEWKYVADLKTDFDLSLPEIPCLEGEFNQVILNIIINAAHAIQAVTGKNSAVKGVILVKTLKAEDRVEIRIRDTGCGIKPEIHSRIFDPFFTTKEVGKGTGQGLAISHSVIADKHGGTLTFDTEPGKGTTFIIRLPMV